MARPHRGAHRRRQDGGDRRPRLRERTGGRRYDPTPAPTAGPVSGPPGRGRQPRRARPARRGPAGRTHRDRAVPGLRRPAHAAGSCRGRPIARPRRRPAADRTPARWRSRPAGLALRARGVRCPHRDPGHAGQPPAAAGLRLLTEGLAPRGRAARLRHRARRRRGPPVPAVPSYCPPSGGARRTKGGSHRRRTGPAGRRDDRDPRGGHRTRAGRGGVRPDRPGPGPAHGHRQAGGAVAPAGLAAGGNGHGAVPDGGRGPAGPDRLRAHRRRGRQPGGHGRRASEDAPRQGPQGRPARRTHAPCRRRGPATPAPGAPGHSGQQRGRRAGRHPDRRGRPGPGPVGPRYRAGPRTGPGATQRPRQPQRRPQDHPRGRRRAGRRHGPGQGRRALHRRGPDGGAGLDRRPRSVTAWVGAVVGAPGPAAGAGAATHRVDAAGAHRQLGVGAYGRRRLRPPRSRPVAVGRPRPRP